MTKTLLFQTMLWLFTKCWIWQHCWNWVQLHLQTLQSKSELTQKDFVVLYPGQHLKGFGLASLSGACRGFMPPRLNTNKQVHSLFFVFLPKYLSAYLCMHITSFAMYWDWKKIHVIHKMNSTIPNADIMTWSKVKINSSPIHSWN